MVRSFVYEKLKVNDLNIKENYYLYIDAQQFYKNNQISNYIQSRWNDKI